MRITLIGVWLTAALGAQLAAQEPLRIVVELPAYRLDAFVGDSIVQTSPVAVGMAAYRTPRGLFRLTSIEWNPWWTPPDRPWAAREKRTPPGPTNPMGRVKLNFGPLYFLHGNPDTSSIGHAASHGCVRMRDADAIRLATLVHQLAAPKVSEPEIARMLADADHTHTIAIKDSVPVEIRYDLAEVRTDTVFVYRDVYRLGTRSARDEIYAAAARAGIDTLGLDPERVLEFARLAGARAAAIRLESLQLMDAGDGARTRTPLRERDFMSLATADFGTPAIQQGPRASSEELVACLVARP